MDRDAPAQRRFTLENLRSMGFSPCKSSRFIPAPVVNRKKSCKRHGLKPMLRRFSKSRNVHEFKKVQSLTVGEFTSVPELRTTNAP